MGGGSILLKKDRGKPRPTMHCCHSQHPRYKRFIYRLDIRVRIQSEPYRTQEHCTAQVLRAGQELPLSDVIFFAETYPTGILGVVGRVYDKLLFIRKKMPPSRAGRRPSKC